MIDRLRVQRAHPADVIGILGEIRQQLCVHHHAALARRTERKFRRRDGETRLPAGHRGESLTVADALRQVFVIIGLHLRLVVEQIHLRRSTDHVQVDHALGLWRKLRPLSMRIRCIRQRLAKQRSQRRTTEHVFTASEELMTGLIGVPFLEEVHGILS